MAQFIAYELSDPRYEPDLPRYIGWGAAPVPWRSLWDHRDHLQNPLGLWFRSLAADGLEPLPTWVFGKVYYHTLTTARLMARSRLWQACKWVGGNIPDFMVNLPTPKPWDKRSRPVLYLNKYGPIAAYKSVREAAGAAGIARRTLQRWLEMGHIDAHGGLYALTAPCGERAMAHECAA